MKVLHINTRLTQGGAGRVASDLHQRLLLLAVDSHFAYGYASGIQDDAATANIENTRRLASKISVLTNFATHRVLGFELVMPSSRRMETILSDVDVIHVHNVHHYFLPFARLFPALARARKPIFHTAHDWWWATGRCAIPSTCRQWNEGCGACGERKRGDLPVLFDMSRPIHRLKRRMIDEFKCRLHIIAPSRHIENDMKTAFSGVPVHLLRNTVDLAFENALKTEANVRNDRRSDRTTILVSAADLSFQDKTDQKVIKQLIASTNSQLVTIGRNSPFSGTNVQNLGYISGRRILLSHLRSCDAYLFTSTVDNAPLVVVEALCSGTYVLASPSPAARELLALVGGRPFSSTQEASEIIRSKNFAFLYGGQDNSSLASKARDVFSGERWARTHIELYREAVARASVA